jgi:hypothetical protein
MPEITERITFRPGHKTKTMHIEVEGCIVNITVGLRDTYGRRVTRVDVSPDDESRGGDGNGNIWRQEPGDARIICVSDARKDDEG